jgi:hypothetical protein
MPDICMCNGGACPLKETCYRFTAKPSKYLQSYFVTPPFEGNECEHYCPTKATDRPRPCDQK